MSTNLEALINQANQHRSGRKKTKYPPKFKRQVVSLLSNFSIDDLALKLGVGYSTLQKWKKIYASPQNESTVQRIRPPKDEIKFSPVLTNHSAPNSCESDSQPTNSIQFSYSDSCGRHVNISIPWDKVAADSLFQFVGEQMIARCKK